VLAEYPSLKQSEGLRQELNFEEEISLKKTEE
jgi:hypothetical protein